MPASNSPRRKSGPPEHPITHEVEKAVGISVEDMCALYVLDDIKGFGPQKFKHLHEAHCSPSKAVTDPSSIPLGGKRGEQVREHLNRANDEVRSKCRNRAEKQIRLAFQHGARIVTYSDSDYPANVYASNNPVPILYEGRSRPVKGG